MNGNHPSMIRTMQKHKNHGIIIYLQELPSLGESHGMISPFQLLITGQFPADLLNLFVDIHQETILCVLRREKEHITSTKEVCNIYSLLHLNVLAKDSFESERMKT